MSVDLKIGTNVEAKFLVKKLEPRTAKNGNPFLFGEVFDKDGVYAACIWDPATIQAAPKPGQILHAEWKVKEFKNEVQLDVAGPWKCGDPSPEELREYVRVGVVSKDEWIAFYEEHIEWKIEDEAIAAAIRIAIGEPAFWVAPAARAMHQNWIGGLAEHTHRILRMFVGLRASGHPTIVSCRFSLVVAGIVLHDWGKTLEYEQTAPGQFDYTPWSSLLGHLAGGPITIAKKLVEHRIVFPSTELEQHFYHVLLAHHGQVEWGSPIEPCSKEAMVVHFLDNLDGRLSSCEETESGEWCKAIRRRVFHYGIDP